MKVTPHLLPRKQMGKGTLAVESATFVQAEQEGVTAAHGHVPVLTRPVDFVGVSVDDVSNRPRMGNDKRQCSPVVDINVFARSGEGDDDPSGSHQFVGERRAICCVIVILDTALNLQLSSSTRESRCHCTSLSA